MIAKVEIGVASLGDLCEKACDSYRRELAGAEDMYDVKCVVECLADVVRLWEAVDNFAHNGVLLLTIERRAQKEKDNGTDR